MTNEEKAKMLVDGLGIIYTDCNRLTIKKLLMKMAQWKDEQFAQEKQQLINNVADFINKRFYIGINNHVISKEDYYSLTELIRDFEQSMKGE